MSRIKLPLNVRKFIFITLAVVFSACAPTPLASPPAPTATIIPTVIPTSTQNWSATSTAIAHQTDAKFENLVTLVKAQDPNIDFTELRMAFARTSQYDPYGLQYRQLRDEMVAESDADNFEYSLELANEFLTINYIFPEAHIVAIRAYDALNKPEDADFHRYVLNGLVKSILASGDGTTPQSAYEIVLIEEEYLILEVKGIKDPVNREEFVEGCDTFDGFDSISGQIITVYFNPRIPIQSFLNSLSIYNDSYNLPSSGC
ncbi:MAG: DUF4919 domain-containing protein [Anaerolineae bacterium]|nr:DUF4919 domain-containing protein [Anaerolineae bacterium]